MKMEPQNGFRKTRRRLKKKQRALLRKMRRQIREQGVYEERRGNVAWFILGDARLFLGPEVRDREVT